MLLTLSLHMSEKGDSCFPGMELLAEETGLSRSTVSAAIKEAHELGWIDKTSGGGRGKGGRGISNHYFARFPEGYTVREPDGSVFHNRPADEQEPSGSRTQGRQEDEGVSNETPGGGGADAPGKVKTPLALMFEAWSWNVGTRPMTQSERGKWVRGFNELIAAGVEPEQMSALCKEYRRKFPQAELNPKALAGNLSALARDDMKPGETQADRVRRVMEERGIA